ncbi:hypothetical protein J2Z32_003217 [Paenibacillus turicensis]|uniref:DUF2997 domain-containing protein n=1 Tax=Paenibacillus turicensis TaxID=160487 RepID=A0ABS4FVG8_9BACL|nr:hypothetical protein [Paenibacillus turicensis]
MAKKIQIQIFPDGQIKAEVMGVKGKGCMDYLEVLEQLLDAEIVDSEYTAEYYETEQVVIEEQQVPIINTNVQQGNR